MKRPIILIILFLLLFSAAACERTDMFEAGNAYNSIVGWFDAGQGISKTVTDEVYLWEDKDERGFFFYGNNAPGFMPVIINNSLNNLPTLVGSNNVFLENSEVSLSAPSTLIFVIGNSNFPKTIIGDYNRTAPLINAESDRFYIKPSSTSLIITIPFSDISSSYKIFTIQFTEDSKIIAHENKSKIYDEKISEKPEFKGIIIGNDSSRNNGFSGNIAELILFRTSISDSVREKIVSELMDKYNL